jgi:plasmid stabilization system protein ParE
MSEFRIVWSSPASAQAEAAQRWWLENRSGDALVREMERAMALLARFPQLGALVPRKRGVRRIHLRKTKYSIYYVPIMAERTIFVLAFWHAARGSGPPL